MYTIKYNGETIHDPRLNLYVREPAFHLAVSEAGSGSFILDPDHPAYNQLQQLSGVVELQADGAPIFRGRVLRESMDFWKSKTFEIEGLLACLNDSILPPFSYPDDFPDAEQATNTIQYFLSWMLGQHNTQVTDSQKIQLGTVTVTDPNNYISRSSEKHFTTMEAVKNKLLEPLGGYMLVRYETGGTYLDYVSALPLTNTQRVQFADNLLDLTRERDGADIYTAILPTGADGLTIENEADGEITPDLVKNGKIIYSKSGRAQYGNITRIIEWSDVTLSSNLQRKAAQQLAVGLGALDRIDVKAVDLGFSDADVQSFRVGRNTLVYSTPHGIDASLPLLELDPDILDPGNTQIVLGVSTVTFTGAANAQNNAVTEQLQQATAAVENVAGQIEGVAIEATRQITEAVQSSQAVIFAALEEYTRTGDFESYQQTVSSQLTQLADSITLQVQTVTKEITRVDNDAQQRITDITKYFRFGADGLFIGETGNEVLLRLDNDTIQFLRNNFAELWLDPSGLHADNVQVRRFQIGNFEIVGEPDGRLTLRKAVN